MPGPRRYRVEVWDRQNAERLAIFTTDARIDRRRILGGEEVLSIAASILDDATAELGRGSVLRIQEEGGDGEFQLYRYTGTRRRRGQDGGLTLQLSADALWMDLRQGMLRDVQADGRTLTEFGLVGLTPEEWLTDFILPAYDGDAVNFDVGTVELGHGIDLTFDSTSPLEALRMLEAELQQFGEGGEVQFRLNAAGDTYLVDILARIGSTEGAELRYEKNLRSIERVEEEGAVATRLYARGADGLGLADARWTIAAIAGSAVSFEEDPSPVFEDGVFVGIYLYIPGVGARQITASSEGNGTITLASVAGLSVGDVGWLATDTDGTPLPYLESPSAVAEAGIRVGAVATDIPNVANLLANGDLAEWAGGTPEGWSGLGPPVLAQSTLPIYAKHGGRAAHVTADEAGKGLISDAIPITADETRPYHSILAGVTLVEGRVRMELRHSNGKVYPLQEQAQSVDVGVYTMLRSYPVDAEPLPEGTAQLAIVAHGGPAEFFLDAGMVTRSMGEVRPEFLVGAGAQLLWRHAAAELALQTRPAVEYRIDIVDLFELDPDAFEFDRLQLGDDVRVRDAEFPPATLRVVEIQQDLYDPGATRINVAADALSRPNDPWRHRQRLPRFPRDGTLPRRGPELLSASQEISDEDGLLYVTVQGNAATANVLLFTRQSRSAAWPDEPAHTLDASSGTFPGLEHPIYWMAVPVDADGTEGPAITGGQRPPERDLSHGQALWFERLLEAYVIDPDTGGTTGPLPSATTLRVKAVAGALVQGARLHILGGEVDHTEEFAVADLINKGVRYSDALGEDPINLTKAWPRDGELYEITLTPYPGFEADEVAGTPGTPLELVAEAPGGIPEPYSDAHPATRNFVLEAVAAGGGDVTSVFGRTGAVVAQANDYSFAQIGSKPTTLSGYGITDAVPASRTITAGAGLTGGGDLSANRTIALSAPVSVAHGGTGRDTLGAAGNLLSSNGTSPVTLLGGTNGHFLKRVSNAWTGGLITPSDLAPNPTAGKVLGLVSGPTLEWRDNIADNATLLNGEPGSFYRSLANATDKLIVARIQGDTVEVNKFLRSTGGAPPADPTWEQLAASDIASGTFNIARIPTGTTSSTVALGDHLHAGVYEPVFSTLSVAKGGTGRSTLTANALLAGNGTGIVNLIGGTDGQFLKRASGAWASGNILPGNLAASPEAGKVLGLVSGPTLAWITNNAEDANTLNGQPGSFYRQFSNMTDKLIPAQITGSTTVANLFLRSTGGTPPADPTWAALTAGDIGPGLFGGSGRYDFPNRVFIRDAASDTLANAGALAIKSSSNAPFISWHATDGSRRGFLQMRATDARLFVDDNIPLRLETGGSTRLEINSNNFVAWPGSTGGYFAVNNVANTLTVFQVFNTGNIAFTGEMTGGAVPAARLRPGTFGGSGNYFFPNALRVLDGFGGSFSAAGGIALKGAFAPFLSYHGSDGARFGYLQMTVDRVILNIADAAARIELWTRGSERARITDRLLIGTTANGNAAANGLRAMGDSEFGASVYVTNRLLLNTAIPGNSGLGGLRATGRSEFTDRVDIFDGRKTSARRLKFGIHDFRDGAELLRRLQPRSFQWRGTGEPAIGAVADEVAAVDRRFGDDEGYRTDALLWAAIGGWQDHDLRIESQEQRIIRLETDNAQLRQLLEAA